ncbi:hypothetical protein RND81_12G212000 [Saponaria officinalis]|uniref:Uncharacterized protein n=1 Tax=Saponaria officinalis TaxID=3572 RepID=A0AAW1HDF3_SAPOF
MATKLWLIVVVLALLIVAHEATSSYNDANWGMTRLSSGDGDHPVMRSCNGRVGDDQDLLGSESDRRQLASRRWHISYDAMKRDRVLCNRPGQSYYYCRSNVRANPYRRGCTFITHCARDLIS